MATELRNISDEYQRLGQSGLDAAMRSYSEAGSGFQAFAAEIANYSKGAFDDYVHMWEQLLGSKTIEQAIQVQTQYAKTAYENHVAEISKLGEMFTRLSSDSYKPLEQAAAKAGVPNRLQSS
jgi:phasin family protein